MEGRLEREKKKKKKKEGRKHQHYFMDTINISNLVLGELKRRVLFLGLILIHLLVPCKEKPMSNQSLG